MEVLCMNEFNIICNHDIYDGLPDREGKGFPKSWSDG